MSMQGFDPKWKDFPDYILGITSEIWERAAYIPYTNTTHQI